MLLVRGFSILIGVVWFSTPPVSCLICMDYDIGKGKRAHPHILVARNAKCAQMVAVRVIDQKPGQDPHCQFLRFVGGTSDEDGSRKYINRTMGSIQALSYHCNKDFCNGNLKEFVGFATSLGRCITSAITNTRKEYYEPIEEAFSEYEKSAKENKMKIDKELADYKDVYDKNGIRHFTGIKCVRAYLHVDDQYNESRVTFRKSPHSTHCSADIMFDRHLCRLVRLKLTSLTLEGADEGFGVIHRDREETDLLRTWYLCTYDFCSLNLLTTLGDIQASKDNKTNQCLGDAISHAIELFQARLYAAHKSHRSLPLRVRERLEDTVDFNDTVNEEPKRTTIPLLDRFRTIDPELLRISDENREMAEISALWIQRVIVSLTLLSVCVLSFFGLRRNRELFDGAFA